MVHAGGAAGLAEAEINVAVLLDSGRGVAHDAAQAALWYARAALRGNHRAEYNLAGLYATGEGVPRNLAAATALYRAAAAGGLAAAATKLKTLDRAEPSADIAARSLTAATPLAPAGDVTEATAAEIVWSAPEQPVPVRYFVEVVAIEDGGWHDVFTAYSDTPAVLAQLKPGPSTYAWRVYTVARNTLHYAASPWTQFRLQRAGGAPPPQAGGGSPPADRIPGPRLIFARPRVCSGSCSCNPLCQPARGAGSARPGRSAHECGRPDGRDRDGQVDGRRRVQARQNPGLRCRCRRASVAGERRPRRSRDRGRLPRCGPQRPDRPTGPPTSRHGRNRALRRLEAIVHPLVRARNEAFLGRARRSGRRVAVLDIPLLLETGGDRRVDLVVVVTAPHDVQSRACVSAGR